MIRAFPFACLICLAVAAPACAVGLPFFVGGASPYDAPPQLQAKDAPWNAPWDEAQPSGRWSGLTVGTEVFAAAGAGRGGRGGFGGATYVGYGNEFANNIVVSAQGSVGYLPGLSQYGPRGYDFGMAEVKIGYDMGRLMPYVTLGAGIARPTSTLNGAPKGFDALNDMFVGSQPATTITTVGAGVDYAITDRLTVGVQVNAVQQRGGWGAPLVPQPGMP